MTLSVAALRRAFGVDRITPEEAGALLAAIVGLAASGMATRLALNAGAAPALVLPFARELLEFGLPVLVAVRALTLLLAWLAVTRWWPSRRAEATAAVGLFWFLWGTWQAWLLLART